MIRTGLAALLVAAQCPVTSPFGAVPTTPKGDREAFVEWQQNVRPKRTKNGDWFDEADAAAEESAFRRYQAKSKKLQEHNELYEEGKVPYRLKLTEYADLSDADEDERIKKTGLRPPTAAEYNDQPKPQRSLVRHSSQKRRLSGGATFDGSDWEDWLPAVDQQSPCNSCWAFAASASIVGNFHIWQASTCGASGRRLSAKSGKSRHHPDRHPLSATYPSSVPTTDECADDYPMSGLATRAHSEQQLMDCDAGHPAGTDCELGGMPSSAFAWVAENGVALESDQPYQGEDGTCDPTGMSTILSCSRDGGVADGCTDADSWPPYYCAEANTLSDSAFIDALKEMLTLAPVAVTMRSCAMDAMYAGGVIPASYGECESSTGSSTPDHAVTLIGWGEDAISGLAFWKLRNSWGTDWGESGNFRMERTATVAGLKTGGSYDPCIALGAQYSA